MLYGYPDKSGAIAQVCNDETVDVLPNGAVELTQEQAANRWDWRLVTGRLVHLPCPSPAHYFDNGAWVLGQELATEIERARINADSLRFLAETDWYIIRQQETGEAVPADVLSGRQAARKAVVR